MTKQAKKQMNIRPLDEMDIDLRTKDLLGRALEIYNSGAIKYQRPLTLGLPQDKNIAMDECIKCTDGIINHFAPEWQALAAPKFLGYALLSSIAQDPLIRAGIETIADDMTRKFIELTSKGDEDLSIKIGELEADLRAFRVKSLFNRSLSLTGYMGGCLVYIDVGDLDEEEKKAPLYLDSATFKRGSLRGFKIIEPINVYPGVYNSSDPTADNYFNPETWFVLGKEYHKSRFLYFTQNEVPLLLKPLYNFFGISLSQQVLEYVQNFTENRRSAQRLLNKFSLTIWKTDMSAFLSGGDCNSLTQRVKYFNAQRNNDGTALIDKDLEDMVQINTPLSGVTDIVSMSLDLAPVILGISKDKYFGDLPKGLNASSEGTNRIYYDKIQSLNGKISYDNVEKVIKILQLNRYGEIDDNISFQFAPLWEMDERERAEINKIHADTAAVYVDRGCLSQEEVRGALADNPDSGYSNIDVDDVPETDNFADVDLDDKDETGSVFDGAEDISWITIGNNEETGKKGTHIPVEEGESHQQATERFLQSKGRSINKGYEIQKETPKAYLLKKDNKTFWVQKRWLREDGTLTPAGEKAFNEAPTDEQKAKEKENRKAKREFGVPLPAKPDWESDKAYGFDLTLDFYDTEQTKRHRIFIPKSVIQKNGNIPTWILEKKIEEIGDYYNRNKWGGYTIQSHPFDHYLGFNDWSGWSADENSLQANDCAPELYTLTNGELQISYDNGRNFEKISDTSCYSPQ